MEDQLVTFALGDEEFGFDIMAVQEIIRLPQMSHIPQTPAYVEGVANLRGEVLPVLDTRLRFGMASVETTDRTRVLVLDLDGTKTGLKVDRVTHVSRYDTADMESPPDTLRQARDRFLRGILKTEGGKRMVLALDAAAVCQMELGAQAAGSGNGKSSILETVDKAVEGLNEVEQMVTFRLGREEFALPMTEVREILRVQQPTEIPKSPPYLLGILTVRGRILPIIDLRSLLEQPSLADDLVASANELGSRWESWLSEGERQGQAFRRRVEVLQSDSRAWLDALRTSSQVLMEGVARVRGDLNRLGRAASDEEARDYGQQLLEALRELERELPRHVRDDQRVVVVQVQESLLGLVVDHVNEVLNIPLSCLAESPRILQTHHLETSRIARMDNGKRLIQVLSARELFSDTQLNEMETTNRPEAPVAVAQGQTASDEVQIVTFMLEGEEFGTPITQVQEIDRHSKVARVPRAPEFVHGVTNLRGEVIPVIDTRHCCNLPARTPDDRTRVIIVDMDGSKTGLVVDSVREVLSVRCADISPPPRVVASHLDRPFVSGIARLDSGKRMIVLIDVQQILTRTQRAALEKPATAEKPVVVESPVEAPLAAKPAAKRKGN